MKQSSEIIDINKAHNCHITYSKSAELIKYYIINGTEKPNVKYPSYAVKKGLKRVAYLWRFEGIICWEVNC
jgi:hypothetical protein